MTACAITDHGNMYAAYKFYSALKSANIKPIIGCEIYIAPRTMKDKDHGIDNKYYHMTLLAKNLEGYKNLIKIVSIGHMDGFYYKPRVDFDVLSKYSSGLISLSGCLNGVISQPIANGNIKLARENLHKYSELFKDNFYIEIQRNGMKVQEEVNTELLSYSKEFNLPIVATCDAHFLNKEDAELQEIVWCIRDGKTLDDPTRSKMQTGEHYVKTPEEMDELFKDLPEAIENTQKIVERIEDYDLAFGRVEPVYKDLPEGMDSAAMLRSLTMEGGAEKYGGMTDALRERLDYELKVIDDKGYNDYFLIVRDFVKFCHDSGIVVGIRGSACGSAVAYCIGITHVEPISWELYFERFLNPERKSPPDIDIDVADSRRDELIAWTVEKFGADCVKQIGTFSKLQTRQAIRDIARVLGVDLGIADRLSKMVVIEFGKAKSIDWMIEKNSEFAEIINSNEDLQRLASIVRKLSGLHRGVSTHACGIIITPQPTVEYCPIQRDAHGDGFGMTQFEMGDTESIGLMKYDFLGLRNLSIIGNTVAKIKRGSDRDIDIFKMDMTDSKAYDVIKKGHTVGVFQMESEGMRKVIKQLKPETLEEISYILAAYRPGPLQFIPEYIAVKNGEKQAEYLVPELEKILSVTNGVITYQEQVIRIAVDIAGYTMGQADMLRKAMGKKIMEVMNKEKPHFVDGAVERGFDAGKIEQLWERLLQFANYGFNKAHSASYAYVTYWTAWLKSNYPIEFMAALLEADLDNFNHVVIDMEECKRMGIQVLQPNINKSDFYFKVEDGKDVRFGLAGIKNVGEDIAKLLVKERETNGEYYNLDDFIYRLIDSKLSVKAVEYFIKVGAFDDFGTREQLISVLPNMFERYKKLRQTEVVGNIDLFASPEEKYDSSAVRHIKVATELPVVEPMNESEKLQWEKDLLGLYVSSNPLDDYEEFFKEKRVTRIIELQEKKEGDVVILGGIITKIRRTTTKKNDNMAFVTLTDKSGSIDLVIFPRSFEKVKNELNPDLPVLFAGRVNKRDTETSIIVEKAKALDPAKHARKFEGITFKVRDFHTEDDISNLKDVIRSNPGDVAVRIMIYKENDDPTSVVLNNRVAMTDEVSEMISKFV
jgi:DNA polymerase-3 subunit alpha